MRDLRLICNILNKFQGEPHGHAYGFDLNGPETPCHPLIRAQFTKIK